MTPLQCSNSSYRRLSSTFQLRLPTKRVALSGASSSSDVLVFLEVVSASSSALRFLEGPSVFSSADSESEPDSESSESSESLSESSLSEASDWW